MDLLSDLQQTVHFIYVCRKPGGAGDAAAPAGDSGA
jgi:hypothetical protein